MPSSTFSSEPRRIPGARWGTTWFLAVLLAIGAVWWCERTTRQTGQRPSVSDDPTWWAMARRRVDNDPKVVAFVGTSRMELAYSAQAFAQSAPELRGVQLAIHGLRAVDVLEDLAADEHFRGLAVVDVNEQDIGWNDLPNGTVAYIEREHALWRAPGAVANRYLAANAQKDLAVLAVGGRRILTSLLGHHGWPAPHPVVGDYDRTSHGYYSLSDPGSLRRAATFRYANFEAPPPPPAQWLVFAERYDSLARTIRRHGGEVVFVRLPSSGKLAELFERDYPKARYWDAFASIGTSPTIHFRDVPAMAGIKCPDEMHLDQSDQATFTSALVQALRSRGLLRETAHPF